MSASASAIPGGQPSTTQPMAGPCDSPKTVTQNSLPSVLPDMGISREMVRGSAPKSSTGAASHPGAAARRACPLPETSASHRSDGGYIERPVCEETVDEITCRSRLGTQEAAV